MEFCLVQPAFVENSDDISFTVLICDIERSIQIKTDSQRVIHFRVCHCSERLKTAYLVSFTEEILNGNLHFLCSVYTTIYLLWFLDFCIYCICFNIFFVWKLFWRHSWTYGWRAIHCWRKRISEAISWDK